jgi:hypothetical protein
MGSDPTVRYILRNVPPAVILTWTKPIEAALKR